jgi:uncharacterized protein (DUF58 family)
VLTSRGRIALLLAAGMYLAAWALGTREAFVPAIGLALLPGFAVIYVRLVRGPFTLTRRGGPGEHVEGGDLEVRAVVERTGGLPASAARLYDTLPAVGETGVPLRQQGDVLIGGYVLRGLPRGRYRLDRARLEVDDPFGLATRSLVVAASGSIVVYPLIADLDRLFTDHGGASGSAGRYLLSRGAGFDLHSVREHQQGESLRRVHWPSTARRQTLMVKELEDSPRDEAAVILDCMGGLDVGTAPDSSFEMMVRAAGSLLRRLVAEGRRTSLVLSGARVDRTAVTSLEGDWRTALDVLATVRPDGHRPLISVLNDGRAGLDAARLFLVTADLSARLEERIALVGGRREVNVVWVDTRSWEAPEAIGGAADLVAASLVRRGVGVARLHRGVDLAAVLSRGAAPAASSTAVPV